MGKRCYYEVLGVSREADLVTIKKSYRRVALDCHPDRCPGDKTAEERFKEAAEAFDVLSNQEKRAIYDRYGHEGLQGRMATGFSGIEDIFSHFGDVFGDIFGMGDFFGRRTASRRRVERGADYRYDLVIPLEEAVSGIEREIELGEEALCEACKGSGMEPGTSAEQCPDCDGSGQSMERKGFFTLATTCYTCRGQGRIVKTPCKKCRGNGRMPAKRTVKVRIPAGVDTGMRLRLQGQGEKMPPPGEPGDLYVFITVEDHERFERHGDDLYTLVDVSFAQAALGTKRDLGAIDGTIALDIPAGTQPGEMLRVPRCGVPHVDGDGRGDLFARIRVAVPKKLSKEARKLIQELEPLL